jgi:hypothetical protein
VIRWLRQLLKPRVRRKEQNRVASLRAVRVNQRQQLPGFAYDYGDFEENKRRAAELRRKAQKEDG